MARANRGTDTRSAPDAPAGRSTSPPTIHDVARAAAVGVGTVSRVLADSPRVAPETRERVRAVMRQLGYRPSAVARALSRGRTQTLEVVVPLFTRYFYVEVLRGIEAALADTDYALVIRSVERAADRDRIFDSLGNRDRADGVILVSLVPTPAVVDRLARSGLPAVLVDADHPQVPSVSVDHAAAARLAVEHLLALGHRGIALIDHPDDPFTPGQPSGRQSGYRAALASAGIAPRPDLEVVTDFSPEAGTAALDVLLGRPDPPTAVFVGSDTQAIGVLESARQRGLRVPGDLSVIGYNDVELARYLGLTTIRIPMREMGQRGANLLLAALENAEEVPTPTRLTAKLVVRRTSGPPES